jgi:4-hydroxy-4-methyl-2-oxoglutarate aldolase
MDTPIECGGVKVRTGDVVFGDVDGVVIVPQEIEEEVFRRALQKVTSENNTRDELRQGRLLAQVYEKYGVL